MSQRVALRRGKAADWAAINPVLSAGEPGFASDVAQLRFGDGVHRWNDLPIVIADSRVFVLSSLLFISSNPPSSPAPGSIWLQSETGGSPFTAIPTPPGPQTYAGTCDVTGTGTLVASSAPTAAGTVSYVSTGTLSATGHL